MVDFDWTGAKRTYRDVLASNPSIEHAHRGYASLLAVQGRHDDAIRAADVARELDPLCLVPSVTAAWTRYMAGRYDAAVDVCHQTMEMGGWYVPAVRVLGLALLQAGEASEAAAALDQAIAAVGRDPQLVATLAHVSAALGRRDDAEALIVELLDSATQRYVSAYQLALAYVGVDRIDEAFIALERAYRDRDPNLAHVAIEPRFEPLRSDRRFNQLLESMNLTRAIRFA
jgi:tetratricopeptide (TPR) repeat protein